MEILRSFFGDKSGHVNAKNKGPDNPASVNPESVHGALKYMIEQGVRYPENSPISLATDFRIVSRKGEDLPARLTFNSFQNGSKRESVLAGLNIVNTGGAVVASRTWNANMEDFERKKCIVITSHLDVLYGFGGNRLGTALFEASDDVINFLVMHYKIWGNMPVVAKIIDGAWSKERGRKNWTKDIARKNGYKRTSNENIFLRWYR